MVAILRNKKKKLNSNNSNAQLNNPFLNRKVYLRIQLYHLFPQSMTSASALSQVKDFLKKCNLVDYYDRFVAEGFDQLQSLLDVTETDLTAMGVKRGHRRRLQREIATFKGISLDQPIYIPLGDQSVLNGILNNVPSRIPQTPSAISTATSESQEGNRAPEDDEPSDPQSTPGSKCTKRKYKRHPKRDKNAPVKPLSAYVMFAHKVREEYRGKNIPFPEMAKIVGDRWKKIPPEEKKIIEADAFKAKEEYHASLSVYKTTEDWRQYQEYLKEFKEKNEPNCRYCMIDIKKFSLTIVKKSFCIARVSSGARKRQKLETSQDLDTTTPSEYSSNQSSIGYHADNGSGNLSSGSSNSNSNENEIHVSRHHHYISRRTSTPYSQRERPHSCPPNDYYNPAPYYSDSSTSNSFVAPLSNVSHETNSTILDGFSAKDSDTYNFQGERNGSASENSAFSPENYSVSNRTPIAGNSETDDPPPISR